MIFNHFFLTLLILKSKPIWDLQKPLINSHFLHSRPKKLYVIKSEEKKTKNEIVVLGINGSEEKYMEIYCHELLQGPDRTDEAQESGDKNVVVSKDFTVGFK